MAWCTHTHLLTASRMCASTSISALPQGMHTSTLSRLQVRQASCWRTHPCHCTSLMHSGSSTQQLPSYGHVSCQTAEISCCQHSPSLHTQLPHTSTQPRQSTAAL
jgi:hypothetical protein